MIAAKRRQFGSALRNLRDRRGWTLRDLGQKSGVSFRCLGLIESGERGLGPGHASKVASALGLEKVELAQFLKRASQTLTERGRNRVTTGCPPHLAQIFGQHLSLVLRMDLAKVEAGGCIQLPSPSPFLKSGVLGPTLYWACEKGATFVNPKPAVWEQINSHKGFPVLMLVYRRNGEQVLVRCGAQIF